MQGTHHSYNNTPCFVVPGILHIPGPASTSSDLEDNASLLERSAQDRDNWASAASLQSALAMNQHCKLQIKLNSLHQPAGINHSLWEIPNGGPTTSSIKQNFPAGWLRYRQFLGKVIKTRYVIYAVLIHHASQLGIHHLEERWQKRRATRQWKS